MKKIFLSIIAAITLCSAHAQTQQYRVVGVSDGDTIRALSSDNQQIKCRLHAIDAPEMKGMAYGQQSKQSLSEMVFQKMVEVTVVDQDQYGRSVCRITVNGMDVNKAQLERGMAWHYTRYSRDAGYAQAESVARRQRIGLWADANPTPPWSYRRNEKSGRN